MPLVVDGVGYGLAWSVGLAELDIPLSLPDGSDLLRFGYLLLLRLIEGRIPFPIVVSGLIWGASGTRHLFCRDSTQPGRIPWFPLQCSWLACWP
jgi:hypothetical protein